MFAFAEHASTNPTFYADIVEPQTLNKYQYALNNPLRYIDLDGHQQSKSLTDQIKDGLAAIWERTGGRIFGNNEKSPREEAAEHPNIGPGGQLPSSGELVERANRLAGDALWQVGELLALGDRTGITHAAGQILKYRYGQADARDVGIALAGVLTSGKPLLLGENMAGRVMPVAEKIGARVYAPRGEAMIANTTRMIDRVIASGKPILDIGRDVERAASKFYAAETERLIAKGYHRVANGTVTVKQVTYQIYKWVRN